MTGMAVLLLARPIVRHRDRFAQSNERGDGWSAAGQGSAEVVLAAFTTPSGGGWIIFGKHLSRQAKFDTMMVCRQKRRHEQHHDPQP
jgi:hypothetical protein